MKQRYKRGKVRYGLSNYLVGRASFADALCNTNLKNLDLIFSGPVPPNPSELLNNDRFDTLIKEAKKLYDIVIIDTPPLGSVIDAAVIAKQCDGTIMVIKNGAISRRFAKKVKDQLEMTDCKILGVVLNKIQVASKSYYGKYYGKYYGNYYENNETK